MDREETTMQAIASEESTMQGLRERGSTPAWADHLVRRVQQGHDAPMATQVPAAEWIPGAIAALWTLLDEAVAQATAALARAGLPERILTRRTEREYWLSMSGPDGAPRQIALFASLRAVHGHASGGAQLTTSQTRASIYLVPSLAGGRLRWLVPAAAAACTKPSGAEFTARVVDDLLLSVFGDDPAATLRLAPYFSLPAGA
jgi:hypothetical protein